MNKIPTVNLGYFQTNDEKLLKKRVTEFCKKNLVGKKLKLDNNLTIELTWQGLKNDINEYHQFYIEKLVSFAVLTDILKQSIFIRTEKPKNHRNAKKIYKYYSIVKVGRRYFDIIIVIKETSRTYLYDHILIK